MKMKVQNSYFLFLILTFLCVFGNFCKSNAEATTPSTENTGTLHDDGQINWDEQSRIYYYYEPNDPGPSSRPLVILLHGGSININRLLGLERQDQIAPSKLWFNIADEEKIYLAIPQGYQNHWNDCRGDCEHCGDEDDIGFINEMINEIQNRYLIDDQRIYTTGLSNGGILSYRLAFEMSHRIAAIAAIIANLPANDVCSGAVNPIPVLIMNGTADTLIPWEGGQSSIEGIGKFLSVDETVDFWVNFNNCDSIPESFNLPDGPFEDNSTVSCDIYDNGIQNTEVFLYRIDGGGHVEPSIEEQYNLGEGLLGKQNHDIEMAYEVWNFLKRHTLSGGTSVNNSFDDQPAKTFHLSQNYPNPFNTTTTIEYYLPKPSAVTLKIYNIYGQEMQTLENEAMQPGIHKIEWNGKNHQGRTVGTGLYVLRMKAGEFVHSKKIVFLK